MDYGTIKVTTIKNASSLLYIPNWDKVSIEVNYTKYNIKETDFRVKTASFTSPIHFDITTGQFAVLIASNYHENFSGIILDVEYDEETKLYTYQCQDWSRKWIDKFELVCKNVKLYNLLRYLITVGGVDFRSPTKKQIKNYKNVLKGLAAIGKYDQSLYKGNVYKSNPMKNKVTLIARDKSYIEVIRSLVFSQLGYFDVYFSDDGVLHIAPMSKVDWENTGLILSDGDYYNRKFEFSTTNAITGVIVNGSERKGGDWVMPETQIGLSLQAIFGSSVTSISNPNDTSNAVKTNKNTKTTTKTTTKTSTKPMNNPFNNKKKRIIVSADGGSGGFKNGMIQKLKADGWSVTDLGTGPGTHSRSYNILSKKYAVNLTIYNGADPETIKEPVTGWLKGRHEKYGVQLVQMFDTSSWTNPRGMKPYRYGNFNGYTCNKAWDDNYSGKSNAQARIKDLGAWYKKYYKKAIHVCGPTVSQAFQQFKAGGYLKSKGLVK